MEKRPADGIAMRPIMPPAGKSANGDGLAHHRRYGRVLSQTSAEPIRRFRKLAELEGGNCQQRSEARRRVAHRTNRVQDYWLAISIALAMRRNVDL